MTIYELIHWCWQFGKEDEIDYREIYLAYQDYKDRTKEERDEE